MTTKDPWRDAFMQLEAAIRDVQSMAGLTAMAAADGENDLVLFNLYRLRDETQALADRWRKLHAKASA
jgi:hypothetical protein